MRAASFAFSLPEPEQQLACPQSVESPATIKLFSPTKETIWWLDEKNDTWKRYQDGIILEDYGLASVTAQTGSTAQVNPESKVTQYYLIEYHARAWSLAATQLYSCAIGVFPYRTKDLALFSSPEIVR